MRVLARRHLVASGVALSTATLSIVSVRVFRGLTVVHPLRGGADRYLIDLRNLVQLVACEVAALRQLTTNLRVRRRLLLVGLLALRLLLHLFEAHALLLLAPAATELVGQAPLLLDSLWVLDYRHVLRVVESYLRRLRVWVHGYWVRVRELVALRAAVIRLDYFTRSGRWLARGRAAAQAVNVRILLGLLLVDGLGSGVAGGWRVARGDHGVLSGGRRHVCLVVLKHH